MRVSICQYETVWMNLSANLNIIADNCRLLTNKTDLLVLPEMFNTGYVMNPQDIPFSWQDDTISTLKDLAVQYKITIAGSIPMHRKGQWFNTFIIVNEKGLVGEYDKIHLFTLAGEKDRYASGTKTHFYKVDDWDILPLVCYDLRFPYLGFGQKQPDILIYSANWPETRVSHWKTLLKARAIENQCYVVGVNRTGRDENGFIYSGESTIIDFNGEVMARMENESNCLTQVLDKQSLLAFRAKLPFFNDRNIDFLN